ncbi:MAG: peroxiredoxin [Opitutaceae bacterium]
MKTSTIFALLAGAGALGWSAPLRAAPLRVGDPAPVVTGTDQAGAPLNLGDVYKKQTYTLVYFFPRAFTSGCTAQGCSIRDAWGALEKDGVTVIGVSTDPVEKQAQFKAKEHFPFTLIADPGKTVIDAFHVPTHTYPGIGTIATREAYLIKDGRVVWADYHAATRRQAADVLRVIASMKS